MADYNTNENGMSRRNFLRYSAAIGGAGAIAAATGCSPFERMPESFELPYNRFVKETMDDLSGNATKFEDVAWTGHQDKLGERYTTALRWLSNVNREATKVVNGQLLHRQSTLHSIHGNRKELADALKLDDATKAKFVESYIASLSSEQKDLLDDSLRARTALLNQLGEYQAHSVALAEIHSHIEKGTYGPLTETMKGLASAYENNAKKIQANLRAQIWMNVAEAKYAHTGSDLGQLIDLDDRLENSRSKFGFLEQGRVVYKNVNVLDGKNTVTLGDYKDKMLLAAEKHFKARDRNFEHDIIMDNRSPVAKAIFGKYADGKLSLDQAQGALHELDSKLNTVAQKTPVEGSSFLETVIGYLPGIHFAASLEDWPLIGTPNTATGVEAKVLEQCAKAYLGWPSFRAGDEDPAGRAAIAALLFAAEIATAVAIAKASRGSSSSGQSGQGVGGGQTTITPIR